MQRNMNLQVFNGEKFERNKLRYIVFSGIFISSIVISIINQNIIGAIVLFFILGAYFYYSILSNKKIKIKIQKEYLMVDEKTYARKEFSGYMIETNKQKTETKNIIFIDVKGYMIYTIDDNEENIEEFGENLKEYLPLLDSFNQSFLEKMIRLLKL